MQNYRKTLKQLISSNITSWKTFQDLLTILRQNHQIISASQSSKPSKAYILQFLQKQLQAVQPSQTFYMFYSQLLDFLYKNKSKMIPVTYQVLPLLFIRSIIINQHKKQGLDQCLITIYNHQYMKYNAVGDRRQEMTNSFDMQKIYQSLMNKQLTSQQWNKLERITQITINNRDNLKALLLWLWYSQIGSIGDKSVLGYFNLIYTYFGGNEKQINKGVSLYLLQKRSVLNLYKYSISQQEMQWIILALYDLAIQRQNFKYELLAAINIVYKKAANECQFRLSQIAQSVIHLLQDQYSEVF